MDFNVDEVGLWVIYSTHDSNNTLVAKVARCLYLYPLSDNKPLSFA